MGNLLIYAILVTFITYGIIGAYFDGHLFIGVRTFFERLKERSVERKNYIGYFIGYLCTCYFCTSYWISWAVAAAAYWIAFMPDLPTSHAVLIIFGTGCFSAAILDILNQVITEKYIPEMGCFFPWHEKDFNDDPIDIDEEDKTDSSDSALDTVDSSFKEEESDLEKNERDNEMEQTYDC